MSEWPYPHPRRGVCVRQCVSYQFCHDGCGKRTRLVTHTSAKDGYVRGEPVVWVHHHNLNRFPKPGGFSRVGIPSERIAPLARWLHDHYGGWDNAGSVTGIPSPTLRGIRRRGRVTPSTARDVIKAVLVHSRPRDPFAIYELPEPPRIARPKLREWNPRGVKVSPDRAKPLVRRITRHLGGTNPAAKALADYYDINWRAAQKMLCRLRNGEQRVLQGTIDHLEDFLEFIEREVEAA